VLPASPAACHAEAEVLAAGLAGVTADGYKICWPLWQYPQHGLGVKLLWLVVGFSLSSLRERRKRVNWIFAGFISLDLSVAPKI